MDVRVDRGDRVLEAEFAHRLAEAVVEDGHRSRQVHRDDELRPGAGDASALAEDPACVVDVVDPVVGDDEVEDGFAEREILSAPRDDGGVREFRHGDPVAAPPRGAQPRVEPRHAAAASEAGGERGEGKPGAGSEVEDLQAPPVLDRFEQAKPEGRRPEREVVEDRDDPGIVEVEIAVAFHGGDDDRPAASSAR